MLPFPAALPLSRQGLDYSAGVIRRHRRQIGSPRHKVNPVPARAETAGDLPLICLAEPRAPGRWLLGSGHSEVMSKVGGKLAVIEYGLLYGVTQALGHAGEDPESEFAHGAWAGP